ncbi:premnaspirodiene oxygenase-like [Rutidosis leptorrhynchoides]|uniref:premnaspirodiene oxygenase-like n=1 Tax=Rutidosis leptorrhynchoides TaxID=125765 RepID=UPI003A9A5D4E
MELQFNIPPLFIATIFFVLFIITHFKISKSHNNNSIKLPPQPRKLPLIGHLHHLSRGLPHHALGTVANKFGPIVGLHLGEISTVLISSPTLAKEILKTHDLAFASRPKMISGEIIGYNYKDIAACPYGDYWRQMRKICVLELLSTKKVQSFHSVREQESWNLVESVTKQTSKTIKLNENILLLTNNILCRVSVGSICKDQKLLVALFKEFLSYTAGFDASDLFPSIKLLHLITGTRNKLLKIRTKIDKILDNFISGHQERRAGAQSRHNEDLLDVLLRLKDDGGLELPLASDNVKAVIIDMLLAGTDTSSSTIDWAMSELIKNPRVMKKLQDELRQTFKGKKKIYESDIQELVYLKQVIKETLRLHPPAPLLLPRLSRENCEIGGYHIPANTTIIINAWKIGRDPDYWTDPESFVPERFTENSFSNMITKDFEYLPFGGGRRVCPGMSMGLANVELPLATLMYHFDWDLPKGVTSENLDMTESFGATVCRKTDLLLVPTLYNTNQ